MLDRNRRIAPTPVSELLVTRGSDHHTVLLKHECQHPSGSVKERTALGLLRALDRERPLVAGTVVVESTSGNLGIAMAGLLADIGCHFIAVVDPKTPAVSLRALTEAGAELHLVEEHDGQGGYLLTRLDAVRRILRSRPDYRWPNQYENPANPDIHEESTAPEIIEQGGQHLDAVYVAVSTGGTAAGIARHVRGSGRAIRVIAVDVFHSLASEVCPGPRTEMPATARLLPGIGASRRSSFLEAGSVDGRHQIRDSDAIAMCRMLREDTMIGIGGSAGCVLTACVTDLFGPAAPAFPLLLMPDDASKYEDTVYDDAWLAKVGLLDAVESAIRSFRRQGLSFKASEPPRAG